MIKSSSSETPLSSQPDDGFWSALLNQDEVNHSRPEIAEEYEGAWEPTEPSNDQSTWSDSTVLPQKPWKTAQELFDNDESIELAVSGHNKGGLLVNWNGLQGFVPASQLLNFPQFHLESERLQALSKWHDKKLLLKIIELNPASNRLIFSERAALVNIDQKEEMLHQVEVDQVLQGEVTNLTNFGAFVDLGGVEGLIHISELSWSRVTHPAQIVSPGQSVQVKVIQIDEDEERIALSLKRLKKNPWQDVANRYFVGQFVRGPVSNVVNFGAFVRLEDELEGLIHISELAEGSFLHPRDVVRKGDIVLARVIHVDGKGKRLALSLRGVDQSQQP